MQNNNTKSSVVAGLLGIFLGAFGGHDWYLGNTKRAITHVSLCVGGALLMMVGLILTSIFRDITALNLLFMAIIVAAYIIMVGNGIWGFIEGVIIIAQGDPGLAAKGYAVATPIENAVDMAPANPNETAQSAESTITAAPANTTPDITPDTTPDTAPVATPAAEPTKPAATTVSSTEPSLDTAKPTEPAAETATPAATTTPDVETPKPAEPTVTDTTGSAATEAKADQPDVNADKPTEPTIDATKPAEAPAVSSTEPTTDTTTPATPAA